jgi:hypothetical protein
MGWNPREVASGAKNGAERRGMQGQNVEGRTQKAKGGNPSAFSILPSAFVG